MSVTPTPSAAALALAEAVAPFVAQFDAVRPALPGAGYAWADALRARGIAGFAARGFPTRSVEAWKYTDTRKLAALALASATGAAGPAAEVGAAPAALATVAETGIAARAVMVNGRFRPDLSDLGGLPPGVRLCSLAALLDQGDRLVEAQLGSVLAAGERPLLGLNAALMADGMVLELPPGTVVEQPIRLLFLTDTARPPTAMFTRNLIVAGAMSRATVVETWQGGDAAAYAQNAVAEVAVGEGARLNHYRLQAEGCQAVHLSQTLVRLAKAAAYDSFTLSVGAEWSRSEAEACLDGPGGELRLGGAYLATGSQHVDHTTLIDHAQPDCRSREVFKGVLDGRARGVFQGKIRVQRGAQRTDGYQLNRALLLSKTAEIDSKPELEIYADDVKCSHGATAGEIDHDSLFYLRARGIGEAQARALLVEAFIQEAIEEITDEAVRAKFAAAVTGWLGAREPAAEAA